MAYCSTDLFKIFPFSIDNYVCLFIYLLFFFFFSLSSKNCHRCAKKKRWPWNTILPTTLPNAEPHPTLIETDRPITHVSVANCSFISGNNTLKLLIKPTSRKTKYKAILKTSHDLALSFAMTSFVCFDS